MIFLELFFIDYTSFHPLKQIHAYPILQLYMDFVAFASL